MEKIIRIINSGLIKIDKYHLTLMTAVFIFALLLFWGYQLNKIIEIPYIVHMQTKQTGKHRDFTSMLPATNKTNDLKKKVDQQENQLFSYVSLAKNPFENSTQKLISITAGDNYKSYEYDLKLVKDSNSESAPKITLLGIVKTNTIKQALIRYNNETFLVANKDHIGDLTILDIVETWIILTYNDQKFIYHLE